MEQTWNPIDPANWRSTPALTGRVAVESDVASGVAVFYTPGDTQAVEMELPRAAIQRLEDGTALPVVVVQAELMPSGIVLGVRPLSGGNGVCLEHEVEYVSDFNAG
jgi:hypothetical protein